MKRNYVHVELLIGKKVVDADGRKVGRIEEVVVVKRGGEWIVKAYLVGGYGIMERFSIHHFGVMITRLLGATGTGPTAETISWRDIDLSDPEHPRLKKRQ